MANSTRIPNHDNLDLPRDLVTLGVLIEELPAAYRAKLEDAYQAVVESTCRRRRILSLVQDALGQLRLDMKYLLFDLEATRRERDLARQHKDEA